MTWLPAINFILILILFYFLISARYQLYKFVKKQEEFDEENKALKKEFDKNQAEFDATLQSIEKID